tara:strand:- start:1222 stop:2376 length:1155 start_codon:yes stop_codon:yes gene_type:complete
MATVNHLPFSWRYIWLAALVCLPVLGWWGILDDFSSEDINASISSAGLIYGTARGINALVSLLQGTEFSIPFLTFSIGEVLDPVNDLIERFSDIVFLALGSLALQKILLALVSQWMFNVLLSIVAVCSGLSIFLGSAKVTSGLLRVFLVVAFFRFSLGLVVLANSWVDATFLDEADQQRLVAMESFQGELKQINTLSKQSEEAAAAFGDTQAALSKAKLMKSREQQAVQDSTSNIARVEQTLQTAAEKAGRMCALSISTPILSPTCPQSVRDMQVEIDRLKERLEASENTISKLDDEIAEHLENMACLENRRRGEKCHFWEILPDVPNVTVVQQKLNNIETRVSDFAENTINLLVSLLLKSIAIPLLFFFLLLQSARISWTKVS